MPPTGDQRGCQASSGLASRSTAGEPSVPTRKIRRDSRISPGKPSIVTGPPGWTIEGRPARSSRTTQATASARPSGDQLNSVTSPGTAASGRSAGEPGRHSAACAEPPAVLIIAMQPPSGAHRGHHASAVPADIRCPVEFLGPSSRTARRGASIASSSQDSTNARRPSGPSCGSLTSLSRVRSLNCRPGGITAASCRSPCGRRLRASGAVPSQHFGCLSRASIA